MRLTDEDIEYLESGCGFQFAADAAQEIRELRARLAASEAENAALREVLSLAAEFLETWRHGLEVSERGAAWALSDAISRARAVIGKEASDAE